MVKSVVQGKGNHVNITEGSGSPIHTSQESGTTQPRLTVQARHRFIYTLLAWGTATAFLVALLVISLLWPSPTPPQLRVQVSILALAAAGFATVLSGLLNVKMQLGTQLTVGATGALAVLVLFYFYNPAVLS